MSIVVSRSIRGSGMQVHSFQSEEGVEYAKRVVAHYETQSSETFRITFAAEAEIPPAWPSPVTGEEGLLLTPAGHRVPQPVVDAKHERTHLDMVRERRTEAELENILQWRLGMLRDKRGTGSR